MSATTTENPALSKAAAYDAAAFLHVAILDDLAAVEPIWRDLEARAILSPYQRFDWIRAYLEAGFEPDVRCAFVVLYDGGTAIALLPLTIKRQAFVQLGQIIGMPISNTDCLIFDPASRDKLTPAALRSMFAALRCAGFPVDMMSFHCVFPDWQGLGNPLLQFRHAAAPNRLYFTELEPFNPEGKYALPLRRRKNIRYSLRKLETEFGPLRLVRAETEDDIEKAEALFIAQRARRFEQMGVENIFARPQFRRFFVGLANQGREQAKPALAMHIFYAGDTPLATGIGAYSGTHYSHYMNSTTSGEPAKYSIIGALLTLLMDELRRGGTTSFDIGLGDFDYKAEWTAPHTVYDCLVPVTLAGRVAAPALGILRRIKRTIKQTPALWRIARAALAFKVRLGSKTRRT